MILRYTDVETGEYVSTEVGRCDREQKCGYHKRPRDFFDEHGGGPRKEYFFPKVRRKSIPDDHYSVVAAQLAKDTMIAYEKNNLMLFIKSRWGKDALQHVISTYRIGTCPCLKNAKVSTWLMKHSTQAQKDDGLDIGDWLIKLPSVKSFRIEDFI